MKYSLFAFLICLLFFSCKKNSTQNPLIGQWVWTLEMPDNPYYFTTPQSTGVNEILTFTSTGDYNIADNGTVVNFGTYKTITAKSTAGQNVLGITYTNSRVSDSTDYYYLANGNDSLFFVHDLIGTVGSGSRHYGRK